jgi:hypothetical protein
MGFSEFDSVSSFASGPMQCSTRDGISTVLQITSITLEGVGYITACTGVGASVGLVAGGLGVGTHLIDVFVSRLPCTSTTNLEEVKGLIKHEICEELRNRGNICNSDKV